jgi:signal transduction histidine kinase
MAKAHQSLELENKFLSNTNKTASSKKVLQAAVNYAKKVLQARWAAIWVYDERGKKFIVENSVVSSGVSPEHWEQLKGNVTRPRPETASSMGKDGLHVQDINDLNETQKVRESTRNLLEKMGVRSFQKVILKSGGKMFGALYINYKDLHRFTSDQKYLAQQVGLRITWALEKTLLIEKSEQIKQAMQAITEISKLGQKEDTLKLVAKKTKEIITCDLVSLYSYNQKNNKLNMPVIEGELKKDKAWLAEHFSKPLDGESEFSRFLDGVKTVHVLDSGVDYKSSINERLVEEEEIKSFAAIVLKVNNETVGLMFVGYRSEHQFIKEEIKTIELFANQAAMAISNAQMYEKIIGQKAYVNALKEAVKAIRPGVELEQNVLGKILEEALNCLKDNDKRDPILGVIELYDNQEKKLRLVSVYPLAIKNDLTTKRGRQRGIEKNEGGITGRAVRENKPQIVPDVTQDSDYVEFHKDTKSEIAILLTSRRDTILGVLNIESDVPNRFNQEDQEKLEDIAKLAVIAIQVIQAYQQTEAYKESYRKQTEFLSIAAHEIKTPIAIIKAVVERWFRQKIELPESLKKNAEILRRQSHDLEFLLDQMLDLTRIELNVPLKKEKVDIIELTKECISDIEYKAREKEIGIQTNFSPETLPLIVIDRFKVKQIIANLINNAIKFTLYNGKVTISISDLKEEIQVSVQDTGIGIAKEQHEQIFERFFQVSSGSIRLYRGMGIGLSIVKNYVEKHNGKVWVESEPGKGAKFSFTLPKALYQ